MAHEPRSRAEVYRDQRPGLAAASLLRDGSVLLVFCGIAFALRSPSFLRSAIDWDEGLYALMAERLRAGHLPYVTLFDNKPPGVYLIFAAFQSLVGDAVLAMRIAAAAAVTVTAYLVFRIADRLMPAPARSRTVLAAFAGALYIVASVSNGGMAANTEIFVSPFVCLALWLALRSGAFPRPWLGFAVGLVLGCAALVKPVAGFEAVAPFYALYRAAPPWRGAVARAVGAFVPLALGMLVPLAALFALYAVAGQVWTLFDAVILANLRRESEAIPLGNMLRVLGAQALVLPLYLGAAAIFAEAARNIRRSEARDPDLLLALWIAGAIAGAIVAKSFFAHYFLQPLPAMSVATALALSRVLPATERRTVMMVPAFILLALVSGAAATARSTLDPVRHAAVPGLGLVRDTVAEIAAAIRPVLASVPGSTIFVLDGEPISYALAGVAPPTRYAFPPLLIDTRGPYLAGFDAVRETHRILAAQPLFIVTSRDWTTRVDPVHKNEAVYAAVAAALSRDYAPFASFPDAIVYRRATRAPG